MSLEHATHILR